MISRRTFVKGAGGVIAFTGLPNTLRASASDNRPNIVLIIGDDISINDHGVYGHPHIRTPNIDRLAANGLRLNNAYLTSPQCSPTRCSVITGRYPHNTGAPELHMELPEGQVMFPELLKEKGYYTAAMGKWHLGTYAQRAFNQIIDGSRPSGAEHWIQALQERPKDKPFFMWFAAHDAHRGWQSDSKAEPHRPEDAVVPPYMVDSLRTRQDIAKFMDEIQRLDRYVGDVVAELEDQGVLDNTLLISMADNGRPFPRCKAWLYDGGIKTPFIVHWPNGLKKRGMVSNSLISAIDIAPTVLETAGLAIPQTVQGISFSPLFHDPEARIRDYAFAELNWHTQFSHMRMVRWKNYVYIRNSAPELSNMMMAKIDREFVPWLELLRVQEAGELTSAQANVMRRPRPNEELYDVDADFNQLNDLVDQAVHQSALEHLRSIMDCWVTETGDTKPESALRTPDRYSRQTGTRISGIPDNPPRRDWAGKAKNAPAINVPGPR